MCNIGLVLSGGMGKGAYQIGALKAIDEVLPPEEFRYFSSASIGAFNSYAFLTHNLDKAIDLWSNVNSGNKSKLVNRIMRGNYLQNAFKNIVSDVEIEKAFYIPLINIKKRTLLYANIEKMNAKEIETHLCASVAMPVINSGVQINGESYYDGAIVDNIPIYPILKHQIDYIICIYFDNCNYTFENEYLDNKIIKINFPDNTRISSSVLIDNNTIKYMIREGYKRTKRILEYIFANGTQDIPQIYTRIEDFNLMNTNRNLRISGDIVVRNMNKVIKKVTRKQETL